MSVNNSELYEKYFDWIYSMICGDNQYSSLSYYKLLSCLDNIDFVYSIDLDGNRAQDGIDFRYHFGHEKGYPTIEIRNCFGNKKCSVLEMMVALAFKLEEHIMSDYNYGDRTGQWFWSMIVSLGLGTMNDSEFNENYVLRVIDKFLNRDYEPNGKGGLFTIENCPYDVSEMEIWTQSMWYLNEIIKNEGE